MEGQMYHNILIATDGSEFARKAVSQGLALAKDLGARVTAAIIEIPVHMANFPELGLAQMEATQALLAKAQAEHSSKVLAQIAAEAGKLGVACQGIRKQDPHPHKGIIQLAGEKGCDLIVLGSHGRNAMSGALLGSVTMRVVAHTTIPVLVCR
jgi:nucleotide-binding universal stress UspA family protein